MSWLPSFLRRGKTFRHPQPRLSLEELERRDTPSTLIPASGVQDMVYDPQNQTLYMSTSSGQVDRYDEALQIALPAWVVGSSLGGLDITPDGKYLYIAEEQPTPVSSGSIGLIHKVDTTLGISQPITYTPGRYDTGAWDIKIADNGLGLLTSLTTTAWPVPLRQINLSNDTISTRNDLAEVGSNWYLHRSADRSQILLNNFGAFYTYSGATDAFPEQAFGTNYDPFAPASQSAINRDGTLLAVEQAGIVSIFNSSLQTVKLLSNLDGGLAFDPTQDLLYAADSATDQILAYDTHTWTVRYHLDIGESVGAANNFGPGRMLITDDGQSLFLVTSSGVREFSLPTAPGPVSQLVASGFPAFVQAGYPGSLSVTAEDSNGEVVPSYQGTVHFSSSDAQAGLPADYTFTAADHGVHTFTAALGTAGTQSLTVADVANSSLTAAQSGIAVHTAPVSLVPVPGAQDYVYDTAHRMLYISTSTGQVQRYDLANQTLLAPWNVGLSLNGLDLSPDGSALYAAEGQGGIKDGLLYKVRVADSSVQLFSFLLQQTYNYFPNNDRGAWQIATAANGQALFTSTVSGPLRQLDLSSGRISVRSEITQSWPPAPISVVRNASHGQLLVTSMGGLLGSYSAASDSFPARVYTSYGNDSQLTAVNRDGTLMAMQTNGFVYIMNQNLQTIKILWFYQGGLAFDPQRDLLYVAVGRGDGIAAYDTRTWTIQFFFHAGVPLPPANTFGRGNMLVSDDGTTLFLMTPAGILTVPIPRTPGPVSRFVVSGYPAFVQAGYAGSFTVTAEDSYGQVIPNYTGTVHFSSSDGQAVLPTDYTFTAADQGVHTFTAALGTAGTQSLSVADVASSAVTGTQTNIVVHTAPAAVIPVQWLGVRDFVFNPSDQTLYFSMASGEIERYDVADQTLLAPWNVGFHLWGMDLAPDGKSLYAIDNEPGLTNNLLYQVSLADGSVRVLPYRPWFASEDAGSDIKIAANGLGFLTDHNFDGTAVQQLDLSTNTLSTRTDTPGYGQAGQLLNYPEIERSADRSVLFLTDPKTSSGPAFTYDAGTNTFPSAATLNVDLRNCPTAVNRNGTLLAFDSSAATILDPKLHVVTQLTGIDGGIAFSPAGDTFFGASTSADQIIAYDTNTWAEEYRVTIGEPIQPARPFGAGLMRLSDDGRVLFMTTASGVRVVNLPAPEETVLAVSPATAANTAGAPLAFTVTVEDAQGNPLTDFQGTVHFSSSDAQAGLPADYTFTSADQGSHAFTVTLKTAGTQQLTVCDAAYQTIASAPASITVSPAAPSSLAVTGFPTPATAGTPGNLTVAVQDSYGNVVPSYYGTVHFGSSDPGASLPADYTFTSADQGTHTFSAVLTTAGTQAITATDTQDSGLSGTLSGIVVQPASLDHLAVAAPSGSTAGTPFTATVTAVDRYNNTIPNYTDTLHFTSSDGLAQLPADYTLTSTDHGSHAFTLTLFTAGTQTIAVSDTTNPSLASSNSIAVSPAAPTVLRVTGFPSPVIAGTPGSFTAAVQDAYGNVVTSYTGTLHFASSDPQANLPPDYTFSSADQGVHTFAATLKTAGTQSLTATDNALTGSQNAVTVTPAALSRFTVSAPASGTAGEAFHVTVTALDPYGNIVTGYTGTIHFTSSDGQASLPPDYTFTAADPGVHTFTITLRTAGNQTIVVTDTASHATGSATVAVSAAKPTTFAVASTLTINNGGVNSSFTVVATDAYGNTYATYSVPLHVGYTTIAGLPVVGTPLAELIRAVGLHEHEKLAGSWTVDQLGSFYVYFDQVLSQTLAAIPAG